MNKKLDLDWDNILINTNPNKLFNIFVEKFNKAQSECITKIISKIYNKAKMHNYVPLDEKTITKIKKKHRAWHGVIIATSSANRRSWI